MKTREEAAKILLEKGWSLEEVLAVLGRNEADATDRITPPQPIWIVPTYYQPYPVYPTWPIWPTVTWEYSANSNTAGQVEIIHADSFQGNI